MKNALFATASLAAGLAVAAIDPNAAAQAALKHAGLSAVPQNALLVTPDFDDGRAVYEVDFHDGAAYRYDYEVDANTGAILKSERKALPQALPSAAAPTVPAAPAATASKTATEAEAKAIVLAQAGVSEADIKRYRAKFEIDDGVPQWEIEFRAGAYEYEATVNAATGAILDFERDKAWWIFD